MAARLRLNEHSIYHVGTGCIVVGGTTIELTVAEEELFELLLKTPKVTVPWTVLESEMARSDQTIRHQMREIRNKLGSTSIRTHVGKGISLQPQFVGMARFRLAAVRRAG